MCLKNKFFIISVLITLPILYFFTTYSNKSKASINLNTRDNSIIENGKQIYAKNYVYFASIADGVSAKVSCKLLF